MIVRLYYDDCRHCSSDDYPYKIIRVVNVNHFWAIWDSDEDLIKCDSDDRSHLEFLKKDRIIEVWIGEEE